MKAKHFFNVSFGRIRELWNQTVIPLIAILIPYSLIKSQTFRENGISQFSPANFLLSNSAIIFYYLEKPRT